MTGEHDRTAAVHREKLMQVRTLSRRVILRADGIET